ncbi:unnamed protein product [Pleuronectes platessa]|uniref:Uncharacterized protein n=1 Tax=Pleuronectes platessa TaxID=8262 RepID=A0A9N7V5V5_PLEPL|nr:unnamed protein product [Pleuronectes platessa]
MRSDAPMTRRDDRQPFPGPVRTLAAPSNISGRAVSSFSPQGLRTNDELRTSSTLTRFCSLHSSLAAVDHVASPHLGREMLVCAVPLMNDRASVFGLE